MSVCERERACQFFCFIMGDWTLVCFILRTNYMERRPYESMTILNNVEGHDSATPALPLNFKDDFHEGGCL